MWTTRSIQDDISIEEYKGFVVAEYQPLELRIEGANEREARDALMTAIWASVARIYEEHIRRMMPTAPTIKNVMDDKIDDYWNTHERKPIVKEEKHGIVLLEVEFPDEFDVPEVDIVRPS